jgi:hypothetical protein
VGSNATVAGWGGLLAWVPNSKSKSVAQSLANIRANATVQQLQAIRAASPTGGAFGNISDYEDKLLASTLASLDQTMNADQLKRNVGIVKFMFDPSTIEARSQIGQAVTAKTMSIEQAQNAYDDLLQKYMFQEHASQGLPKDFSVAPTYVEPFIKDHWDRLDPEDIEKLLTPEDKMAYQKWLQDQAGKQ